MTAERHSSSRWKSVLRVTSGNFLEMYDFQVYGFYAPEIARTFFPARSAFVSLMLSLGTFGAGFLMPAPGGRRAGAYIRPLV